MGTGGGRDSELTVKDVGFEVGTVAAPAVSSLVIFRAVCLSLFLLFRAVLKPIPIVCF